MAYHNRIAGFVPGNRSRLAGSGLFVRGDLRLRIELMLAAPPGVPLEAIRTVKSHPVALRQCSGLLSEHPQWSVVESPDTASAAEQVASDSGRSTGVLTGSRAARHFGLDILLEQVQDREDNETRFLLLGREQAEYTAVNCALVVLNEGHPVEEVMTSRLNPCGIVRWDPVLEENDAETGSAYIVELRSSEMLPEVEFRSWIQQVYPGSRLLGLYPAGPLIRG